MKKIVYLLLTVFSVPFSFSQNTEITKLQIPDNHSTYGVTVHPLNNGNYVSLVNTYDTATYEYKSQIHYIDQNNSVIWSKELDGSLPGVDLYMEGMYTDGTNMYPVLYTSPTQSVIISKMNPSGNIEWSNVIELDADSFVYVSRVTISNNFVYFIVSYPYAGVGYNHYIHQFDTGGNHTWSRCLYIPAPKNPLYNIQPDGNGGITVSGKRNSDIFAFNIASNGNKNWLKVYNENDEHYTQAQYVSTFENSNNLIFAGARNSVNLNPTSYNFYAIADNNGQILNMYRLDPLYGYPTKLVKNGENVTLVTQYNSRLYLLDINPSGEIIRSRYMVDDYYGTYDIAIKENGHYLIGQLKYENIWTSTVADPVIIHASPDLNSCIYFTDTIAVNYNLDYSPSNSSDISTYTSANINVTTMTLTTSDVNITTEQLCYSAIGIDNTAEIELSVYPNPTHDQLLIQTNENIDQVEILNMEGKPVLKTNINSPVINVADLANGIYMIRIYSGQNFVTRKFVKN